MMMLTWCYGKWKEKNDPSGMSSRYCGFRLLMGLFLLVNMSTPTSTKIH